MTMKSVFTIEQAAAKIGLPRRTMYNYVTAGVIPVVKVTSKRKVMLLWQVEHVQAVLDRFGREGLRQGKAITGFGRKSALPR